MAHHEGSRSSLWTVANKTEESNLNLFCDLAKLSRLKGFCAVGTKIKPQYGTSFDTCDLVDHIRKSGRTYIIQGQQTCSLSDHSKPNSLDVWLRKHHAVNKDTKQADNSVIHQLTMTGLFREGEFRCPDSGKFCKGIEIL